MATPIRPKPTYSSTPGAKPSPATRTEVTQSFGPNAPTLIQTLQPRTNGTGTNGSGGNGNGGGNTHPAYPNITLISVPGLNVNGAVADTQNGANPAFQLFFNLTGIAKSDGAGGLTDAVAGADYVAPSRQINTSNGLIGGGDLTADRTLSLSNYAGATTGYIPTKDGSGGLTWIAPGGTGTVTSVSLAAPGIFTVSGSPVTSSGTLTLSLATQNANTVWAGPTSGSAAAPTFRALVAADLPAGTGTVTSVGLTMPSGFSVSGSPVTSTGTLAVTTTLSGIIKGTGSGFTAATDGTDYLSPTTGVTSVNTRKGAIALAAGTNVSIVESPTNTFTFSSTGGTVPSGTDTQTLRYNGTTLVANDTFWNNGTICGLGAASVLVFGPTGTTYTGAGAYAAWIGTQFSVTGTAPVGGSLTGTSIIQFDANGFRCFKDYFSADGTIGYGGNSGLTNAGYTVKNGLVTGYSAPTPTSSPSLKNVTSYQTANYAIAVTDDIIQMQPAALATITATLPTSGFYSPYGYTKTIANSGAGVVTVNVSGGGDILAGTTLSATFTLNSGETIDVTDDPANGVWVIT